MTLTERQPAAGEAAAALEVAPIAAAQRGFTIYDLLLLVLALVHGVNGARIIISDYVERGGLRSLLIGTLLVITFIWLLLGIFVIVTFDPNGAPAIGPFS